MKRELLDPQSRIQILLVNIKPSQESTRKLEAEKMRLEEEEKKQEGEEG